jgi:hypothetical protein
VVHKDNFGGKSPVLTITEHEGQEGRGDVLWLAKRFLLDCGSELIFCLKVIGQHYTLDPHMFIYVCITNIMCSIKQSKPLVDIMQAFFLCVSHSPSLKCCVLL